jgi:hypothetical protein
MSFLKIFCGSTRIIKIYNPQDIIMSKHYKHLYGGRLINLYLINNKCIKMNYENENDFDTDLAKIDSFITKMTPNKVYEIYPDQVGDNI